MAIVFELVADFGEDVRAARTAATAAAAHGPLPAGSHRIPLHPASLWTDPAGRVELSVVPAGVGIGVAMDAGLPDVGLNAAGFTELGRGLYDLLRGLRGYRAAAVGWDVESSADVGELRTERAADPRGWAVDGLVLADRVLADLGGDDRFVPFAAGSSWLPWEGVRPSSFTADPGR
ncbi:hypothetical protein [Nocardiopsis sp. CC223A]|uniref:hypothetical protein n=1 Tax=Nocardiopsis sp. CC223A TaxID=3044051 RepID=UPI00278BCCF1|nr:hypothetical protein [Nocardiopsis sp. CC223A]